MRPDKLSQVYRSVCPFLSFLPSACHLFPWIPLREKKKGLTRFPLNRTGVTKTHRAVFAVSYGPTFFFFFFSPSLFFFPTGSYISPVPFSGLLLSVCIVGDTLYREKDGRSGACEKSRRISSEWKREGETKEAKPVQWGTALLAFQNGIYRK